MKYTTYWFQFRCCFYACYDKAGFRHVSHPDRGLCAEGGSLRHSLKSHTESWDSFPPQATRPCICPASALKRPWSFVGALWDKWALSSAANGVGGYDWIAIPLVPYLFAVEHLEDVPLFAETTAEQDEALILKYNWSQNRSHFRTISRNCADFVKDVINFYQPTALHRSYA